MYILNSLIPWSRKIFHFVPRNLITKLQVEVWALQQDIQQQGQPGLSPQDAQGPNKTILPTLSPFYQRLKSGYSQPRQVCSKCQHGEEIRVSSLWQKIQGPCKSATSQSNTWGETVYMQVLSQKLYSERKYENSHRKEAQTSSSYRGKSTSNYS